MCWGCENLAFRKRPCSRKPAGNRPIKYARSRGLRLPSPNCVIYEIFIETFMISQHLNCVCNQQSESRTHSIGHEFLVHPMYREQSKRPSLESCGMPFSLSHCSSSHDSKPSTPSNSCSSPAPSFSDDFYWGAAESHLSYPARELQSKLNLGPTGHV